jgi:HAMP domain-containing protein
MKLKRIQEKINTLYKNTSLLTKIRTILISITVLVLVAVLVTLSIFYNQSYSDRMRTQTGRNTLNAVETINVNARNINQRFVSILGSENFATKCKQLISGNSGVGITDFQSFLNDLNNSNYLINASLLITEKDHQIFYSYQTMPRLSLIDLFDLSELSDIRGTTCLSSRSNPFSPSATVLPVVVPLRFINDYLQINKSDNENDLYIILLLDEEKLRTAFSLSGSQTDMENYYLLNASGTVLTSDAPKNELLSAVSTWIPNILNGQINHITLSWQNCYITISELYLPGYCIIGVSRPASFLSTLGSFSGPILSILLLILFIAILLSVILTNTVTRPLSKLLDVVHKIETDQYTEKVTFQTNDEVGQLMNAINTMNDTIHRQMDQIREDEKIKLS